MNINADYNNINFGQKIPTVPFLKMGSGIFDYEEAKKLCHVFDQKFPGHVGYYQKALHHVENIERRNPHLKHILNDIHYLKGKQEKLDAITRFAKELGEEIDVVV